MGIIYFILAFASTLVGSMAGLGGGVIIKPVLDAIGLDNIYTISILSSATVFSMAVVSTVKQVISGFKIRKTFIFMVIGAAIGGVAGKQLFSIFASGYDEEIIQVIQAMILIALLIIALFRRHLPDWEIENPIITALTGAALGTAAAFLGVGGGPINVAVIVMFLAVGIRDAAVVSILIILFSQGAKLLSIGVTGGFAEIEGLFKLFYMIPGGIAGGLFGAVLNRKLDKKFIHRIYNIILVIVIILNIYNIAALLTAS